MVELITPTEFSRRIGVSAQAVHQAIKAGRLSVIEGLMDPRVAQIQWETNRRRAPRIPSTPAVERSHPAADHAPWTSADPINSGVPSLEQSRAKREFHEARLSEMRERQRAGELVEVAQVHLAYTTLAAQLRAALERIPDKLAPRVSAEKSETAIHELLATEVEQALADLARIAAELPEKLSENSKATIQ